jgi:hypothetical protein
MRQGDEARDICVYVGVSFPIISLAPGVVFGHNLPLLGEIHI